MNPNAIEKKTHGKHDKIIKDGQSKISKVNIELLPNLLSCREAYKQKLQKPKND